MKNYRKGKCRRRRSRGFSSTNCFGFTWLKHNATSTGVRFFEGRGGFGEFWGVCAGASCGVVDCAAACGRGVSLAWAKKGGRSCFGLLLGYRREASGRLN